MDMANNQVQPTVISDEQQVQILGFFKQRCMFLGIKYRSKMYFREQAAFVAGVTSGLLSMGSTVPPYWSLCCMTDREIIEDYTQKPDKFILKHG